MKKPYVHVSYIFIHKLWSHYVGIDQSYYTYEYFGVWGKSFTKNNGKYIMLISWIMFGLNINNICPIKLQPYTKRGQKMVCYIDHYF